jgi:alpha-tubulin suppressor-like RCC1 family protein
LTDVIAIAAGPGGNSHYFALKADGTVVGWGNNELGQSELPAGLTDVIAIAAGGYHSLAVVEDQP